MAEETQVPVEQAEDSPTTSVRFTETMAEAKEKIAAADRPTAETFGVDQSSFDKFYNNDVFDWESYGKEQAWKQVQAQKAAEEAPPKRTPPQSTQARQQAQTDDVREVVQNAGLDWNTLEDKVYNQGELDQDDYQALQKIGIPEHVISSYVNMAKTQGQSLIDDIVDRAGGQGTFDAIYEALENRDESFLTKLDALLLDPDTREYGVDLMFKESGIERPGQQTPQAPARQPTYSEGRAAPNNTVTPFNSFEEQIAAMRDPKYRSDVNYRNEVMEKIRASTYEIGSGHLGGL